MEISFFNGLKPGNNLSDLANVATARTNLTLGNVDNTSDANKPVSTAQAATIATKEPIATTTGILDTDFAAFVTRAGGSAAFTRTEMEAGNKLTLNLKAAGLWPKLIAFYPFLGRAETPASKNLISNSYNLTFFPNWSFASWGARGDGWGSYANTGFVPLTGWPEFASGIRQGSFGVDIIQDSTNAFTNYTEFETAGTGRAGASRTRLSLGTGTSNTIAFPGWMQSGAGSSTLTSSGSKVGTWISTQYNDPSTNAIALSRPDVTRKVYQNTTERFSATAQWYPPTDGGGAYATTGNLYLGGGYPSVIRATGSYSTDRPMSCAFFGTALTPLDVTNLVSVISTFRSDRKATLQTGLIVADGDSIMSGFLSVYNGAPGGSLNYLILYPPFAELTRANLTSVAYGGKTTALLASGYAADVHTKEGIATRYITWCGTNDIEAGVSNSTIIANLRTVWTKAKQDGMQTCALTIIKRSDWAQGSAKDTQRIALNALITADVGTYVDQVIDVDSVITYAMTTATYFGDASVFVHPNEACHKLMWAYVAVVLK